MNYGQLILGKYLSTIFEGKEILCDIRPEWLSGLELDYFIPEMGVAFEFQGDQHFEDIFGEEDFLKQKERDALKLALCFRRNISIIRLDASQLNYGKIKRVLAKFNMQIGGKTQIFLELDKESDKYRKTLLESFDANTAKNWSKRNIWADKKTRKILKNKNSDGKLYLYGKVENKIVYWEFVLKFPNDDSISESGVLTNSIWPKSKTSGEIFALLESLPFLIDQNLIVNISFSQWATYNLIADLIGTKLKPVYPKGEWAQIYRKVAGENMNHLARWSKRPYQNW